MSWVDREFHRIQSENMPLRAFCDHCRECVVKLVEKLMSAESLTPEEAHVVASFMLKEQLREKEIGLLAQGLMEEYLDQWWEAIHD